jgi:hypothetical protein
MRLIDADNFRRYAHEQLEMDKTYTADEIIEMIDKQPTVELTDFERDFLKEFSFPL